MEQAEGRFENGTDLTAHAQGIDGPLLHQLLEPLGQGGFAAADRAEKVEDLLALFEALRSVAEIAYDPLDRIFHAVKVGKGRVDLDGPVGEDPAQALIRAGIYEGRFSDRIHH